MHLCTRRLMEKQSGIWTTVNGATTENIRLGTELLQLPKPWCFGLCHKTIDTTIATHLLLMKQLSWKCVFLLTHWRFFLRPQVSLLPMRKHWQDDDNVVFFFTAETRTLVLSSLCSHTERTENFEDFQRRLLQRRIQFSGKAEFLA